MSSLAEQLMADFDDEEEEELPVGETNEDNTEAMDVSGSNGAETGRDFTSGVNDVAEAFAKAYVRQNRVDRGGASFQDWVPKQEHHLTQTSLLMLNLGLNYSDDGSAAPVAGVRTAAGIVTLKDISRLLESVEYERVSREVQEAEDGKSLGASKEYELIVESNSMSARIEDEIAALHRHAVDIYSRKFPELADLVTLPMDYLRTVAVLGNVKDVTTVPLKEVLPSTVIMTVITSAATSGGRSLTEGELNEVLGAASTASALEESQKKLLAYCGGRMRRFAPNLSALLGTDVAARLMGAAGGLESLSMMDANKLASLGVKKTSIAGLSTSATGVRETILNEADLVVSAPASLRKRVLRVIGGKAALAARTDAFQVATLDTAGPLPSDEVGAKLRTELVANIDKWNEPPPSRKIKALPVPDVVTKKRRGGRKARALKEKMGLTELAKARNRMAFGVAEETVGIGDEEVALGMLGASSGRVKIAAVDTQRLGKAAARRLARSGVSGGVKKSGGAGGLTTSLAMGANQGFELQDPTATKRAANAAASKYFGATTSFGGR